MISTSWAAPASALAELPAQFRIVATTPSGEAVGSLRFGTPRSGPHGIAELPYILAGVPLDVSLQVTAEPVPASSPTPLPSSSFAMVKLVKVAGGDKPFYSVKLTAEKDKAGGLDFGYQLLEVPPLPASSPTALPAGTSPAPAPAATGTGGATQN